ncbi:MAG: alpha/beta hydrolase [Oscillospiraceae bacterium]
MKNEIVKLAVNYAAAQLSSEGCGAELTCYTATVTEEVGRKNRHAILICPGGGYDYCSEREAGPVALRFLGAGLNAFVLRYSCVKKRFPTAALEVAAAIKYIRDNADALDINPDKIIACGFSAGGHLAASLSNFWNSPLLTEPLGCKPEDIKPNGSMLCYPVITSGAYCHEGSILNLIGEEQSAELRALVSLEDRVGAHTPPTFLWHCSDDGCVPVENILFYMASLSRAHVPFESHIYDNGGHGLSLCDFTTATWDGHYNPVAATWVDHAIAWALRL